MTGYLPYDANVARLDDLHRRALGAISVASGATIADPFRPTAELVELLSLRARRLRAATHPRRPRLRWAYRAA